MASIKNMLSEYYFIAGEKQAITDIIQELKDDGYERLSSNRLWNIHRCNFNNY